MELFVYVATLSLQLGGSILLLISSFGNIRVKVINDCVGGSSMLLIKNKIVNIGENAVKNSLLNIYMNRASFLLLSIGYLLSIFNSYVIESRNKILIITITFVILICIVVYCVSRTIAKMNAKKYCNIPVSDLPPGTTFFEEYK